MENEEVKVLYLVSIYLIKSLIYQKIIQISVRSWVLLSAFSFSIPVLFSLPHFLPVLPRLNAPCFTAHTTTITIPGTIESNAHIAKP